MINISTHELAPQPPGSASSSSLQRSLVASELFMKDPLETWAQSTAQNDPRFYFNRILPSGETLYNSGQIQAFHNELEKTRVLSGKK